MASGFYHCIYRVYGNGLPKWRNDDHVFREIWKEYFLCDRNFCDDDIFGIVDDTSGINSNFLFFAMIFMVVSGNIRSEQTYARADFFMSSIKLSKSTHKYIVSVFLLDI